MKIAIPFLTAVSLLQVVLFSASCTSSRKLNYFNDLPDSTTIHLPPVKEELRVIEKADLLDITFSAKDPGAVGPFNRQVSAVAGGLDNSPASTTTTPLQGYTVDPNGYIELPVFGKIKVSGMTAAELKTKLTTIVGPYVKDPIVEVKFNSFRITVLGEVRGPGTYNLPMQRTTIFEALAAAGDIPHTAKKFNVHLYRDYNGERTVTKIDLTSKSLLYNQQLFQVKSNDVLYVQTRKGSIFKEDFGLFASVVTLLVSIVTLGFAIAN